jgi:hypothetical protein
MIEDSRLRILQSPVVAVWIVEELPGQVRCADDHGARDAFVRSQRRVTDAIGGRGRGSEIGEVNCFAGVFGLVSREGRTVV